MNDHTYPIMDALASVLADVEQLNMLEDERGRLNPDDIPADHPVIAYEDDIDVLGWYDGQHERGDVLSQHERGNEPTQCGTCLLWWDDAIPSSMTPVPSGRCPFEQFHRDEIDIDSYVLCVDTEIIRDVVLGLGGPTRYLRFVLDASEEAVHGIIGNMLTLDDVIRVEYHDSWSSDVASVTLSDDQTDAVVAAFGYMVGVE